VAHSIRLADGPHRLRQPLGNEKDLGSDLVRKIYKVDKVLPENDQNMVSIDWPRTDHSEAELESP
jgi:hypothetical protein